MGAIPLLDRDGRFQVVEFSLRPETESMQEQMGSKRKLWVRIEGETRPWLLKYSRQGTGEHWSEKLGAELASLMGVPGARVELASADGAPACLVESILPYERDELRNEVVPAGELVHGNELLGAYLQNYDQVTRRAQSGHSYANIDRAIGRAVPGHRYQSVMEAFAGLLVLDAVIGNTDRHHENWALLRGRTGDGELKLAPSYDHASSLGRELHDEARRKHLERGDVSAYVRKAHGAIYGQAMGEHPESPLELVRWALEHHAALLRPWIARASAIGSHQVSDLLARFPESVMSSQARGFCREFVCYTLSELRGF